MIRKPKDQTPFIYTFIKFQMKRQGKPCYLAILSNLCSDQEKCQAGRASLSSWFLPGFPTELTPRGCIVGIFWECIIQHSMPSRIWNLSRSTKTNEPWLRSQDIHIQLRSWDTRLKQRIQGQPSNPAYLLLLECLNPIRVWRFILAKRNWWQFTLE